MRTRSVILLGALLASAAATADEQIHSVKPTVAAVCVMSSQPVEVDGRLDDAAWEAAVPVSGFTISGLEALAPNQTAFRILRDRDALYIGVRCLEQNMDGLEATVANRDGSVWHDDVVELFLDTNHDHESFKQFAVNPLATRFDSDTGSRTWDAEWQAAADTGETGWGVEVRIPFASLKVEPPAAGDVWGLNVCRERQAGGETVLHNWANVQGNFLRPWLFGHLYFAGEDFRLSEEVAREMGERMEVPVWLGLRRERALVDARGVQQQLAYADLLRRSFQQAGELREIHAELAAIYQESPQGAYRERFDPLHEQYLKLQRASQELDVGPLEWAAQTVMIDDLTGQLEDLRWTVKIARLLGDF
ncbi:MAG: carbohydrate binding family 9 domain-containing protein [Armatimonadota bacterium]|nr:carbohydrate binding family 9 domain-containing protein [Armatimonadota bacterium]